MQLLSTIKIPTGRRAVIELLHGDLSAIPAEHAADILVLSAYPGKYTPTPGSLLDALDKKGLSVEELSKNKMCDLRQQLGCWLSDHLTAAQQKQFNFSHILCFEPYLHSEAPEEVVGNIFRCINTFVFDDDHNVVAMPLLATGNQKVAIEKMLPALIENAVFWLGQGLPLDNIKLVVYNKEHIDQVKKLFEAAKRQYEPKVAEKKPVKKMAATGGSASMPRPAAPPSMQQPAPQPIPATTATAATTSAPPKPEEKYDYFISYAHKQTELVHSFVETIRKHNERLSIFYDRSSIPPGGLWIKHISDAIQRAKKVIVLITPDYCNSPVCWDEFQCAKLIEYNTRQQVIQTIYLYSDQALPPIMGIYSYIDCREGDLAKLMDATKSFAELLQAHA
jgi:hypothetical protein